MALTDRDQDPTLTAAPLLTADLTLPQRIKMVLAASSGNLVEWFDFYVYATFSVYFASEFFPAGSQTAQFMKTAAIYLVGFLARPVGGYFFGRLGDRVGRKKAMVTSVTMMAAGSLAFAALPTHSGSYSIGALAPTLMLIVRVVQGFSVGGEYGTTATYMTEIAPKNRRGLFSSFQYVTLIGGQLLAGLVALILQLFLNKQQTHRVGLADPVRHRRVGRGGGLGAATLAHRDARQEAEQPAGVRHLPRCPAIPAVVLGGTRADLCRIAGVLRIHHLHDQIPGQYQHLQPNRRHQSDDHQSGRVHVRPAAVRDALGPDRPAYQHAGLQRDHGGDHRSGAVTAGQHPQRRGGLRDVDLCAAGDVVVHLDRRCGEGGDLPAGGAGDGCRLHLRDRQLAVRRVGRIRRTVDEGQRYRRPVRLVRGGVGGRRLRRILVPLGHRKQNYQDLHESQIDQSFSRRERSIVT